MNGPDIQPDSFVRSSAVQKNSHAHIERPGYEREPGDIPPLDPRTAD